MGKRARNRGRNQRREAAALKRRESLLQTLSHRQKLARAASHIDDAERIIIEWGDHGVSTSIEHDQDGGLKVFAEQVERLPPDLPLIIGDAIQSMRNSLDHIVFALAELNNPRGLTPDQEKKVQFPVPERRLVGIPKELASLGAAAAAAVIGVAPAGQPHDLHDSPLWALHKMSNRDKHRALALIVAVASPGAVELVGYVSGGSFTKATLQQGQKSVIVTIGPGSKVDPQIAVRPSVAFGSGEVSDFEVIKTLQLWHDHIRETVFPPLEVFIVV